MSARAAGFARRLRRRSRTGAALFDALLAMALFGVIAIIVMLWVDQQRKNELAEEAGRQVAILGHAAGHYALTHYADAPGTFSPNSRRLLHSELRTRGILPASFPEVDAMGRELRVWYRRVGSHPAHTRIQVLAGQSRFEVDGDVRVPLRALFKGRGKVRLGLVSGAARCGPVGLTAPCLIGPTVAESLASAPFNAGWIQEGGLMAFYEVSREEYCGDLVLRAATATCPDSAVLGSLNMGAHTLGNVGTLTVGAAGADGYAHTVEVTNDMAVTGDFGVEIRSGRGGLVVDNRVEAGAGIVVRGGLAVYGNVEADVNLRIRTDHIIQGNLDVKGEADADNVRAQTMRIDESAAENVNVDRLRANSCSDCTR